MLVALAALAGPLAGGAAPRLTHGVASGDVTATSAVVWARGVDAEELVVELATEGSAPRTARAPFDADADSTATARFSGLEPGCEYRYSARAQAADGALSAAAEGRFRTAPAAGARTAVSFVVGGDVGGQGFCRDAEHGYRAFRAMAATEPDFFVANGDLIYADDPCPERRPDGRRQIAGDFLAIADPAVDWRDRAAVREAIFAHWRYNRADAAQQDFLRHVPVYAQWDDHEVINDFGATWESWPQEPQRPGYRQLVEAGRDAVFGWNPIDRNSDEPNRIYRSFRWGRALELFLLDARSYRDANAAADDGERPKAMLGADQVAWLQDGLTASDAVWKIVSSDVPLSVPTGSRADVLGRDGFANGLEPDWSHGETGFERELLELLRALDAADVDHVVFVVTDVHFAMNLRYAVDLDGDGDELLFHELLNGPISAYRLVTAPQLDPTLRPTVLYAEGGFDNFSHVRVEPSADGSWRLVAEIRDEHGDPRYGSRLELNALP